MRPFCLAALAAAALPVQAGDALFNSGLEPGLVVQGRSVFTPRLADGIARAQAGGYEVAVAIRADGHYALVLEDRHLGADPTVLLTAHGRDALAHVVWAGQLGPASRLLDAAGADGVLVADEEALVNLGPWSTAASAAMWADAGFAPVPDAERYERAVRRPPTATIEVAPALALVAQGAMVLPAGFDDTWQAARTLAGLQRLVADYRDLQAASDCDDTPPPPVCAAAPALALDPEVFPPLAPQPNVAYGPTFAGQQIPGRQGELILDSPTQGWLTGFGPRDRRRVDWTVGSDGRLRIVAENGQPLAVRTVLAFVPGVGSIPRELRTTAVLMRLAVGPGGLPLSSWAEEVEYLHPDHPQVPGGTLPPVAAWAWPDRSQAMAALLQAQVPVLSGRFLLPIPQDSTDPSAAGVEVFAYDVLDFASGTARRSGLAFTLIGQAAPERFTLGFPGGTTVGYRLLAEDSPSAWRLAMQVDSTTGADSAQGLLLEVDNPAPLFTLANVPGSWRMEINGQACRGAWGEIGALDPFNFCGPPYFGFQFEPGGTGSGIVGGQIIWQVLGGANAGRLELTRLSGANATQRRGYEMIQDRGRRRWALENWSNQVGDPVPPVTAFVPTHRLTELILIPD